MNTLTLLFAFALAGAALTHYLGFVYKEELLFLDRKKAQKLFFVFFALLIIFGCSLWKENQVSSILWQWVKFFV